MNHYDHRVHAGNAGDVWKHFLLLEAADCLLDPDGSLVYAESHVGRPEYVLKAPGDWEGGIGKIRPLMPSLRNFCYFDILADLNLERPSFIPAIKPVFGSGCISVPTLRPMLYPGSARLIYELAKRKRAKLQADLWDNDPDVAVSWESFTQASAATSLESFPSAKIVFHQGDGFLGVHSCLCNFPPGLLLIDPAYIDPEDIRLAKKLLQKAKDMGWIVLWWYMMDMLTASDGLQTFELRFSDVGQEGGRWRGAVVAFAGGDDERFDRLISHMHRQKEKFIRIIKR